jgi:hypothetical protein
VKDESGDLLADSHNILTGGKPLLSAIECNRISDVRQK